MKWMSGLTFGTGFQEEQSFDEHPFCLDFAD